MAKDVSDPGNQARLGLYIVCGVTISGLALLMIAEAGGGRNWPFNLFLMFAGAALWLYTGVIFRSQQKLWSRVDSSERSQREVENVLVHSLDRLRAGDLVNCADHARQLPGKVAVTFGNAANALDVLAQQIQRSSIEVAAAANSVNEIASELASGSSEQAASVVEITAAMEELARTASMIAENAGTQAELAQRAEESGNAGKEAVEEAVGGVEEVRKRIAGIASRAEVLGVRSKEIYRVLDLITEIAQETHILSLNAAIEAAAAGDHWRRFSVVAEEVRRLAQRSQESVDSVRNLLDEFASSIRATVVATEEGTREATRVLERAQAASDAIEALREASGDSARVAREISLATQQQNAASDEVVLTLKEVSHVVQRMADGLKSFSDTADRLNRLGLIIQMLAQSFHLESPHSLKHIAESWAREVQRRLGNWEAIDRLLQELIQRQPYVECLYFYDAKGSQVALTVNRQIVGDREVPAAVKAGEGFSERIWYKTAVAEENAILTPLFESLLTEKQIFTAAAPVYEKGQLAGVVGLDINVDSWTKI
ncbi:MAG TPA: methyl-accepting chemotaxis protein [Thermoanaerobaculia bacterium]|jgi:methyl-accepting chemotaxis protein|nr:methyl-accepting chemotaxis protein [Thermoanaerobaculia bacterium]